MAKGIKNKVVVIRSYQDDPLVNPELSEISLLSDDDVLAEKMFTWAQTLSLPDQYSFCHGMGMKVDQLINIFLITLNLSFSDWFELTKRNKFTDDKKISEIHEYVTEMKMNIPKKKKVKRKRKNDSESEDDE